MEILSSVTNNMVSASLREQIIQETVVTNSLDGAMLCYLITAVKIFLQHE